MVIHVPVRAMGRAVTGVARAARALRVTPVSCDARGPWERRVSGTVRAAV